MVVNGMGLGKNFGHSVIISACLYTTTSTFGGDNAQ